MSAGTAHATKVYSNFGTDPNLYNIHTSWIVSSTITQYASFVPTGSGELLAIFAAIHHSVPYEVNATVALTLFSDNAGIPGASLVTYSGLSVPKVLDDPTYVYTIQQHSGVAITKGATYWLGAASTFSEGWNFNIVGDVGKRGSSFGFTTDTLPAFEIYVTPEPKTIILGLFSLPALWLVARQNARSVRPFR